MKPSDDDSRDAGPGASLVPGLAVLAVAIVSVVAAVMVQRAETRMQREAALEAVRPPATRAMGGAAACRQCGVVEAAVAVYEQGRTQPRGFELHIRMDDGTMRTIEQPGAFAAGSRVVVEGSNVRPL